MILTRHPPPAPDAPRPRSAFTLLEVLLATAIALLLMGGLYVAIDVVIRQMQMGREAIEESTLVRSILNRIIRDVKPSLSPITGVGATTPEADPTGGLLTGFEYPFNAGVFGDATFVTVFLSRVPGDAYSPMEMTDDPVLSPSDLRRVCYWLAADGGLARQEIPWVTSEDALASVEPDYANEQAYILAPEVKGLQFEYFDGTTWLPSWDGSTPGPDGVTSHGPPLAIAVTLQIQLPSARVGPDGQPALKTVRHVIAVPTSAGTAAVEGAMPLEEAPATDATQTQGEVMP